MLNVFTHLRLKKKFNPSRGSKLICPGCYSDKLKHYEDISPYMVRYRCKVCGMKTIYDRRNADDFEGDKFGFMPKYKKTMTKVWAIKEKNRARIEERQQKKVYI